MWHHPAMVQRLARLQMAASHVDPRVVSAPDKSGETSPERYSGGSRPDTVAPGLLWGCHTLIHRAEAEHAAGAT